jgi:hypothetical protein
VICEELRQQLPDYTLGTLSETEMMAARRHLRGCASCRIEASQLDEGVALFASAAHAADPPAALRDRIMGALSEEWSEAPVSTRGRKYRASFGLAGMAAAVVLLAGALAWAGIAQSNASRFREDAVSYRQFLQALGGRDVRVATLTSQTGSVVEGSAILYDSDHGQSWALVIVRAPGITDPMDVTLFAADGRSIKLKFPLQPDAEGDASDWMVTASDISAYATIRITDVATGRLIAQGIAINQDG